MDMILARAEVDYRSPLVYGDRSRSACAAPRCGARRSCWPRRSCTGASGRLVAEARKVLVHYDYRAGTKKALPEDLRQRLMRQDPDLTIEV